jgi:hypothetical protein
MKWETAAEAPSAIHKQIQIAVFVEICDSTNVFKTILRQRGSQGGLKGPITISQ